MPVAEFGDGEKAMVGDVEREVIACDVARMDAMIIQTRLSLLKRASGCRSSTGRSML
jgi:hypothetical protein